MASSALLASAKYMARLGYKLRDSPIVVTNKSYGMVHSHRNSVDRAEYAETPTFALCHRNHGQKTNHYFRLPKTCSYELARMCSIFGGGQIGLSGDQREGIRLARVPYPRGCALAYQQLLCCCLLP